MFLPMRDSIEYFLFAVVHRIARLLSFRTAERLGALLGDAVFSFTSFRKKVTLENLRHAFPEKSEAERRAIARGAYRNYGIALLEFLWASDKPAVTLIPLVRIQNPEVMRSALERRKGVLFLSGHFGAWEFLVTASSLQFGVPAATLVQHQRNARIDARIDAIRRRFGNDTIPMGVASRRVLTALAENRIVPLLADQSGPKEAVFVEFFGRPAATHRGVAAFSLKSGAPIVMGFLVRQHDGTYTLTLEEVAQHDLGGYNEENIIELTRRHVAVLERWIRRHPDHWLWMHKRWKHTAYYEQQHAVEEQAS